ncbi:Jing interacting gene regulatory 1-like protein [Daphnia magna]|uniref:Jing interacting gene regulatory 1-like protein n=1 Tax=Daphnia magna TaxID=35525 RepID=A0A0P5PZV3_9CRUS|nr:Jing interacting gene regulatory 1-like protein [Daphnia magna]
MAASGGAGSGTSTTNFPDELIIRHVRDHSCLYDPRETEYKDADRKAAVWREIANNVGMSAIECEHRWRYLRDRYTRERKRKSQQTNGCKSGGGGNWPLASQMHFIQDFIKHRSFKFKARGGGGGGQQQEATSDGTNTPRGARQQHVKSEGDNNHTSSDETDGPVSPAFDQQSAAAAECYPMVIIEETDAHHHVGPPRSGTPSDYLRGGGPNDHHHHHRSSTFNNGGSTSPRMTYNEDELFCLSVAQTLRRLPLMRRSLAKVQILQLIHDMEFGSHS